MDSNKVNNQTNYIINSFYSNDIKNIFSKELKLNTIICNNIFKYLNTTINYVKNINNYKNIYKIYNNVNNSLFNINFFGIILTLDNIILENNDVNYNCQSQNITDNYSTYYYKIIKFLYTKLLQINNLKIYPKKYNNKIFNLHYYYSLYYNKNFNIETLISITEISEKYTNFIFYIYHNYYKDKHIFETIDNLN